ncbi:DUF1772 domain-containing protein [Ramlibacter sp. WS9]|uniref:anthrone oxygenase family protein n=1 Tax=Ramlibacter sp. WS9 TaxID=1882741 RepID=UPI0011427901|nr:anthrone oxygenase family protein [Ramlibacter sp. WS9]ROZ66513.1 DUF1772 domain-containing protein [Ramlibacter sp. WS9]
MKLAATVLQVLATCLMGLMAGFFFAFSVDVAPAMRELDVQGYITTQQAINRAVRNLPFALVYFGAAITPFVAALALCLAGRQRDAALWLGVALVYVAGVFLLTREVNVPINNALALWNPQSPPMEWQQARDDWNAANLVRCLVACACFAVAAALPKRSALKA